MKNSYFVALAASAVLTFGYAVSPAAAQAPAPSPDTQTQRAKDPSPVMGSLTNVDAAAKTLTVKLADGNEVSFKYTDTTEITGAKDGAAGLATMKDARVTVHYTENAADKSKTATRVIVQPAQ
jgi:hypothetical protein